jgi:uncharacterized protein
MSQLSRLREIARGSGRPVSPPPPRELVYAPVDADGLPIDDACDHSRVAGATACTTVFGSCLRLDTLFQADASHGRMRVADCDVSLDAALDVLAGRAVVSGSGRRIVYVDLETTGLSGGAGTVPFLVGAGEWTAQGFVTTQFLLPSYASERAMLQAVNDHLADVALVVTFNGRTFDVPVMEMRGELHRLAQHVCALPHLDMLHPARRLWRLADDGARSCRLVHLEEAVLGFGRVGDVPGFEIPARYFAFVRGGSAELLEPVLLHNRLDLLSLAALTARAQRLVQASPEAAADGVEAFGLAGLHERAGAFDVAEACYRRVLADAWSPREARRRAERAPARLLRRLRRYDEAAAVWTMVLELGGRPQELREAREALAVHNEHRARDLGAARRHAEEGMRQAIGRAERDAFNRRLARLARKADRAKRTAAGLWCDADLG